MNRQIVIFIDSDVVISSLISKKGAGYLLINDDSCKKVISNYSQKEINVVIARLKLSKKEFRRIKNKLDEITLTQKILLIKKQYSGYVNDTNDSHIIAGAIKSKSKFLITYNIRHYKIENIKRAFGIITLTPGLFLQYLRNRKK